MPSVLTAARSNRLVHARAVSCTPRSVSSTSGVPRGSDSFGISRQDDPSGAFDSRHDTTNRLNQSIAAAGYMNPEGTGA